MDKIPNVSVDDKILWSAFRLGDEYAFGQIAQKHYASLFRYGSRFSDHREFVKDCIQELFYEMWQRRESLGDTDFVKFYLLKSLRRKIYRESSKKNGPSLETDLDDAIENTDGATIEDEIIALETRDERIRKVSERMRLLSKRQQEAIHLKFFEELDNAAIAQIMGISKQSVTNLTHRALITLRSSL